MSKPEVMIFHALHRNPTCDVILKPNDSHLHFRASSFRLSQASSFFADLFTVPTRTKADPIDIDFSTTVVNIFLAIVNVEILEIPMMNLYHAHELKRLSDKYQCEKMVARVVRVSLETAGRRNPFELLVTAGYHDDVAVGKMALGMIEWSHNPIVSNVVLFYEYIDRLPPTWQLELFRNIHETAGSVITVKKDRSEIAKEFSPSARLDAGAKKRSFDR